MDDNDQYYFCRRVAKDTWICTDPCDVDTALHGAPSAWRAAAKEPNPVIRAVPRCQILPARACVREGLGRDIFHALRLKAHFVSADSFGIAAGAGARSRSPRGSGADG